MTGKPHGMALFRQACLGAACLLAAGCAGLEKPASSGSQAGPVVAESQPTAGRERRTQPRRGPLPIRALNLRSDCAFNDETGYNGAMKLRVASGLVQEFEAKVNHPKHGSCRFALDEFRQVKDLPIVELKSERSRCTVRMWQQGRQVAVAFSACNSNCTGAAVNYLWPILADAYNGSCG